MAQEAWEAPLEKVFPTTVIQETTAPSLSYTKRGPAKAGMRLAKPRVLIPVFPGTNCEYETKKRFELAGAEVEIFIVKNLTPADIEASITAMDAAIQQAQIIALPGGFSAGDEPDGSGKFIATFFRNPRISDAVMELLKNRDGLMLGICNGFQALIKLGLLPYGEIKAIDETQPTLAFNTIGRHMSRIVRTRIASPHLVQQRVLVISTILLFPVKDASLPQKQMKTIANTDCLQYVDDKDNLPISVSILTAYYVVESPSSPDGRTCKWATLKESAAPTLTCR